VAVAGARHSIAPAGAVEPGGPPAARPAGSSDAILWSVIAIALLALIAMVAGQRFARSGQNSGAGSVASADGGGGSGASPMGTAPDISQMSPDERAQRLYALMMRAFTAGHMDTVQMFAPMATGAYQMLDSMTVGERYEYGRLNAITGNPGLAAAEADTILKKHPDNLLGLVLAADAAHANNDAAAQQRYLARLAKAAPAEQARKLPEYQEHADDIKAALDQARKR
jgi:hypothetical protein